MLIVSLTLSLLAGCGAAGQGTADDGDGYQIVPASQCPETDPPNVIKSKPGDPVPASADETYQRWLDGGSFVACSEGESK
jgi:hypothetical protein